MITYEFPDNVLDIPELPIDTDYISPGWYKRPDGNYVFISDMPARPNRKQRRTSEALSRAGQGRIGKTSKRLTKARRRAIVAARKQEAVDGK